MSQLLIGLTGFARTGKTTAAQHLASEHGFECYAFADPIREALGSMLNLGPEDFEGAAKEQLIPWLGRSPRQLMQLLGTEWGRHMISANIWMDLAEQRLNGLADALDSSPGFVISDVRFENEADFIRKRGGVVIHLSRDDAPPVSNHSSEAGVSVQPCDLVLRNNGTITALHHAIDVLVSSMKRRGISRPHAA